MLSLRASNVVASHDPSLLCDYYCGRHGPIFFCVGTHWLLPKPSQIFWYLLSDMFSPESRGGTFSRPWSPRSCRDSFVSFPFNLRSRKTISLVNYLFLHPVLPTDSLCSDVTLTTRRGLLLCLGSPLLTLRDVAFSQTNL